MRHVKTIKVTLSISLCLSPYLPLQSLSGQQTVAWAACDLRGPAGPPGEVPDCGEEADGQEEAEVTEEEEDYDTDLELEGRETEMIYMLHIFSQNSKHGCFILKVQWHATRSGVISRYKPFWKASPYDITGGRVQPNVCWIDQSTSLPCGL